MLKRASTATPLGIVFAVEVSHVFLQRDPFSHNDYTFEDFAFPGATSYLAGTHSEALFRGYLMPVMMEAFGSEFWSNTATATVFAAAHLSKNSLPLPQLLVGWYLGYVAQKNDPSHAVLRFSTLEVQF